MNTTPHIYTGTDDFAKLLIKSDVCIDKSLFIKEFIEDGDEAVLITRPRRWGKSLNVDMLRRFLQVEADDQGQPLPPEECLNRKLFLGGTVTLQTGEKKQLKPLKIAQHQRIIDIYQGKYPVISLGLKNVSGNNYEEIETSLKEKIFTLYDEHSYLQHQAFLTKNQSKKLAKYLNQQITIVDLKASLSFLSELLKQHFQKSVYVFVDEYDAPINHAYQNFKGDATDLDDILELFSELFSAVFKTNPHLEQGLITGILRIAKANIFSGLNNLSEYSLLDKRFATSYGFTQAEVDTLLQQVPAPVSAEQIKAWYNGYTWGGEVIYNPWSIMRCLSEQGELAPYWIDSGNMNLMDEKLADTSVQAHLQNLVKGNSIDTPIITQISFRDLQKTSGLLSLLLFGGYLNPVQRLSDARRSIYRLAIPNYELQYIYETRLLDWVAQQLNIDSDEYFSFMHLLAQGQIDEFEKALQNYLHSAASFHQTGKNVAELFYSGFMLCLLSTLTAYYVIHTEQEGIQGRSDALLIPKPDHCTEALVLEYKVSPQADQLTATAQAGIDQILQKGYVQPAQQYEHVKSALAVSIAFSGKEVTLAQQPIALTQRPHS